MFNADWALSFDNVTKSKHDGNETENLEQYCLYRQYTQSYLLCNATYNRICLILNNNRCRLSSATVWVLKCKTFYTPLYRYIKKMQKIFQKFR